MTKHRSQHTVSRGMKGQAALITLPWRAWVHVHVAWPCLTLYYDKSPLSISNIFVSITLLALTQARTPTHIELDTGWIPPCMHSSEPSSMWQLELKCLTDEIPVFIYSHTHARTELISSLPLVSLCSSKDPVLPFSLAAIASFGFHLYIVKTCMQALFSVNYSLELTIKRKSRCCFFHNVQLSQDH